MSLFKKIGSELNKERRIDISVEKTLKSMKSGYKIVPSMEIKAWKAYLVVTFVAGFAAALIWSAYVSVYPMSRANENTQVTIFTLAPTATHKSGEDFAVPIYLDTADRNIVAVQVVFSYDKNIFQFISADISNSDFSYEVKNAVDTDLGQGYIDLAKPAPGVRGATTKIATLNFRALFDVSEPAVTLKFDSLAAVSDGAAILDDGQGTNILQRVANRISNISPEPEPPPTADFSINSITALSDTIVRISWTEGLNEDKNYIIERKTRKTDFSRIAEAGNSERIFINRSTKPSTTYTYRICQTDDSGEKGCTAERRIKTQKKKKIFKPRLEARIENGKVRLSWLPVYSSDFGIFIQRKADKQKKFTTLSVINSDSDNSYLDENVSTGQKIKYQILVAAKKKKTQKSKLVKITVP